MASKFTIENVFKAIDKVSAPVSKMQNRVRKFTRSAKAGFDKLTRGVKKLSSSLVRGLKFGAITAGVAITGLFFTIKRLSAKADDLAKQSRRLDFPIEELQKWKFVAEQSGVTTELFDSSLAAFSKRLGEAKAGTGALVTFLKKANPQLLKQLINTKDVSKAFEIYINAIRGVTAATDKAGLASAAFSRAGLKLINISHNSEAGIKALKKQMEENGVITQKQAESAEVYNDAINNLTKAFNGLLQNALLPILPKLTSIVDKLRDWIVANKELVSSKVSGFFGELLKDGGSLEKVFSSISNIFSVMVKELPNIGQKLNSVLDGAIKVLKFFGLIEDNKPLSFGIGGAITGNIAQNQTLKPLNLDMFGNIARRDKESSQTNNMSNIISPQRRFSSDIKETISSTINQSEVTIKDETGRAAITSSKPTGNIKLINTGSF